MHRNAAVLRPPKAAEYLGVSLRQLYNLAERDARFPNKVVYSRRCVGWRREALDEYLKEKEVSAE